MVERYITKNGKRFDLEFVECEEIFDRPDEVQVCRIKKDKYLAATEEVEKFY